MAEFTGERVIPGKVDADLWNEHRARYAFAARLARQKRVLDIGCGAGYGAAELAATARQVVGLDPAAEAVDFARDAYPMPNLSLVQGRAQSLPFASSSFQMAVAFEVIEHIVDWADLLAEARRILAPGGQFLVSTPNRIYYDESRRLSGPNPFHEHEFEYEEFRAELRNVFPHVSLFCQNHAEGIVFQPTESTGAAEVRVEGSAPAPQDSHFFVAVCALAPQTGAPTYVYLPSSANVLREREHHITKLEDELARKNQWLEDLRTERQQLLEQFRAQTAELEKSNRWAELLDGQLAAASQRVVALQDELKAEQAAAAETVTQYEAKVMELDAENERKTQWAQATEQRLTGELRQKLDELAACVDALHDTERTLEERTNWALSLQEESKQRGAQLSAVNASRWFKLGRAVGLGPRIGNS